MEANWQTRRDVPLVLFALPDEAARETPLRDRHPHGASLILTHRADGEVPGLDEFAGEHPPVAPVFFGFRIMVGIGMLMLVVAGLGWLAAVARPAAGTLAGADLGAAWR